jgi:hypothetical protein
MCALRCIDRVFGEFGRSVIMAIGGWLVKGGGGHWADLPQVPSQRKDGAAAVPTANFIKIKEYRRQLALSISPLGLNSFEILLNFV